MAYDEDTEIEEAEALPSQIDRGSNLEMVTPRRSERERVIPVKLKDCFTGKVFTAAQSNSTNAVHPPREVQRDPVGRGEEERTIFDVPEAYKDMNERADETL